LPVEEEIQGILQKGAEHTSQEFGAFDFGGEGLAVSCCVPLEYPANSRALLPTSYRSNLQVLEQRRSPTNSDVHRTQDIVVNNKHQIGL
jgi:hypothetical protein